MLLIVRSPLDVDRLKVAIGDTDLVQFDEPLTGLEYDQLANLLRDHPRVTMRVYGTDKQLASMGFLAHFPLLRRFSMAHLRNATSVESLNGLADDTEFLDVGETAKPLDLRPLKFTRLRRLRVSGHTRGLPELITRNQNLVRLSLWHVKSDKVLSDVGLSGLQQLELVQGGVAGLGWISRFPNLRYLAMSRVRGIDDDGLAVLSQLPKLEWLWLNAISAVTTLPDLGQCKLLTRVDIDGMAGLREETALTGLADAPNLHEISITSSRLPVTAVQALANHPTLSAATIGLGHHKRNEQAQAILGVPPARPATGYARLYEI